MAANGIVWKRAGVYFFDLATLDSSRDTIVNWLRVNNFGWAVFQCFDDAYTGPGGPYRFQANMGAWRDAVRGAGLNFGLWGVHHADPTADAARATNQIATWDPDFYIADAEAEYKTDAGGVRANSATFVNAFRSSNPTIKAALTSYGAADPPFAFGDTQDANASVFDYKAWFDAGFHFHPQAYYNQADVLAPLSCVLHAQRANWPLDRVEIIVGIFDEGIRTMTGADYVPMMEATSSLLGSPGKAVSPATSFGFSAFLGDEMAQQDFIDLGSAALSKPFAQNRDKTPSYTELIYSR